MILKKFEKQKDKLIKRDIFDEFDKVNFPIFWIVGLRGVWKSTYLLLKRQQISNSIYISCDRIFLKWVDFLDLIL